jgi:hypothetical protein
MDATCSSMPWVLQLVLSAEKDTEPGDIWHVLPMWQLIEGIMQVYLFIFIVIFLFMKHYGLKRIYKKMLSY